MFQSRIIALIMMLAFTSACVESEQAQQLEIRKGQWIIAQASKDGKATKALDMAYINFVDSAHWSSNLLTDGDTVPFVIQGNSLVSTNDVLTLEVEESSADSLVLSTNMNSTRFQMLFLKEKDL